MTAAIATIRAMQFASLMLLFGASAFLLLLHRRQARVQQESSLLRTIFVAAAIVALAAASSSLPVTAASMGGDWRSAIDSSAVGAVLRHTRFGNLLVLRLAGSLALLIACMRARSLRLEVISSLAAGLLLLLSLTSHAAASAGAPDLMLARAANDAAHLLVGGFWLGSLFVLISLASDGSAAEFLRPVRLFSELGAYAVALLVVTGAVNMATLLFSGRVTWSSAYQQLLAAKILLAAVMIVLAAINRWRLTPAASGGDSHAPRALTRNIAAELTLGLGVVVIAGIIGSIAPN
jgi:putative copper resistance protein D